MKLLLKTLLQRRARDEGFTLPMVIALGLVMLLLAAVSITTANEENLTAITQNSRSDALAIAEIGIAQYREMLDKNRILTIYNRGQWTSSNVGGQNCDVISDTLKGWANNDYDMLPSEPDFSSVGKNYWREVNLNETIVGKDLNNNGNSTDTAATIGWYKIVDYEYDNDKTLGDNNDNGIFNQTADVNSADPANDNDTDNDGMSDTRGILTVKGRSSDGSEAQIQVEIPIRINPDDMTNLAPALWIGDNTVTAGDLGNLTIGNGNVVIQDLPVTTGANKRDGCRSFSSLASTIPRRPVVSDSRSIPSIQKIIDNVASARTALGTSSGNPINPQPPVTPAPAPPVTIPPTPPGADRMIFGSTTDKGYNPNAVSPDSPTDCSHAKIKLCRYYYDFGSTTSDLTSPLLTSTLVDTDLLTDGIANTTLLLNQPLTINATTKPVKIGSTSLINISPSDAFEIYVNGNNNITINATGGTVTINGFIHAPQSKLTINGSKNVIINGSVWVNDFVNNNTANVNISPDSIKKSSSTSDVAYKFYSTTASRTPRPITGSPTNWKTEQIN